MNRISPGRTVSEVILGAKCGHDVTAGDVVVCDVDWVLGTDAATPMAIDYFERMGGTKLFDPARVMLALDHYAPPTPETQGFHDEMRTFAAHHGATLWEAGEGISHQILVESGRLKPGDVVVGADSHTVTCGAVGVFATGVGSSDLAAAMITGQIWLKVPDTIKVTFASQKPRDLSAKDVALAMVKAIGAAGGDYRTLEFHGAVESLTGDDRLVLCNLAVECGAKAAIFPAVPPEPGARYEREVILDPERMAPQVSLPHAPDNVAPLSEALGTPVQMVFIGTCTGGRVSDVHAVLEVLERHGGGIAKGVQLVVTPASAAVQDRLSEDGSLGKLLAMGAIITMPGCGACCGTSGVIPKAGMNVISTANRNFKGRMGEPGASIYLASPVACAAAAVAGRIVAAGD